MTAPPAPAAVDLAVSVVVPTFRRPDLLQRCLQALLDQRLDPRRIEIVVVDDGHDDATRELVTHLASLRPWPQLRYLRPEQGRGPAVARNCGWRAARAALIAFTDDDTLPDAGWLAEGLRAMTEGPWVALAGRVRVPRQSGSPCAPTDHELMTRGLETADFVTANAFVRRAALQQIGGFDEGFRRAWREDSDLYFRLQPLGPVGRSEALVWHPVRPERWGVSLRQQRNVFFDALLYRKHPRRYREQVRAVPPWDYYAIVLLTLGAPLLALADAPRAALLCLAATALLVLRFALRRLRHTARTPAHVAEMLATSALIPFLSVYWRLRGALHFRTPFL